MLYLRPVLQEEMDACYYKLGQEFIVEHLIEPIGELIAIILLN